MITSGPTRQYLDPVRYLTNASSGRMGAALAAAVLQRGHDAVIVSGPVTVDYPPGAHVIDVLTTDEMLHAAGELFPECDGAIGAAAPCDYKPLQVSDQKLSKTGQPLVLELIETPDVIAVLGQSKRSDQWVVGFALETDDRHFRATVKQQKKCCDLMVSNGPEAIDAADNNVELLDRDGSIIETISGSKQHVADRLIHQIHHRLILPCP
ncbi:phosphopantothenoylcysteine decarboxylase domain-containing protein [Allorhodopirellula solitaria]|uniref:phosphopantothenoylcysteine decarboxylase domain-containing protein n=1 Tax=Allorhodopirellula solitaria TaxID=2527987 RepID=UPI0011B3B023